MKAFKDNGAGHLLQSLQERMWMDHCKTSNDVLLWHCNAVAKTLMASCMAQG
jgi:hypothetical protein